MKKQLYIFVYCILSSIFCFSQNVKVDSLEKLLSVEKSDSLKIKFLLNIAKELRSKDPKATLKYAEKALGLAKTANAGKEVYVAYNEIGAAYFYLGDFDRGRSSYMAGLTSAQKIKDDDAIATSLMNIGICFLQTGSYTEALEYNLKSSAIYEKLKDERSLAYVYSNTGLINKYQQNYSEALKYYEKSLVIRKRMKDNMGMCYSYINIGAIYDIKKDFATALDYFIKAMKIAEEEKDKRQCAQAYNNIGSVYQEMNQSEKALLYYQKSLLLMEELESKEGIAMSYLNMGQSYQAKKDYKQTVSFYAQGLEIAKECNSKELIKNAYQLYYEFYSFVKDHKKAFEYYKLHINFRDSLINDENIQKQTRIAMQYEFDKKQTADSVKNTEQAKQESIKHEQEIKQQRTYTYGGIIGFMLMLVVAGISFRAFRHKQKANKIIAIQKALVEEKQKELLDSIHYAKRIQQSLLPTEVYVQKSLTRLNKK